MKSLSAFGLFALIIVGLQTPAVGQSSPAVMNERIETLERQLRLVQRRLNGEQVNLATEGGTAVSSSDRRLLADISAKLGSLERQIRQLNGRLEEFEYRQNDLANSIEQLRTQMSIQREQQLAGAGRQPLQPEQNNVASQPADNAGGETLDALPQEPVAESTAVELPEGTSAERYAYAFAFVRSNDLDSGRAAMEEFLDAHGDDTQAPNAKFWLGRIHMQQGRNAEAAQMFLDLIENHPNHNRRADSLVDLSDVLITLGAAEDACNALAEFRRIEDDTSDRLKANARRLSDRARCNLF